VEWGPGFLLTASSADRDFIRFNATFRGSSRCTTFSRHAVQPAQHLRGGFFEVRLHHRDQVRCTSAELRAAGTTRAGSGGAVRGVDSARMTQTSRS